ncbi:hypothetical protein Tco_0598585 [Tanacetum coccineum]
MGTKVTSSSGSILKEPEIQKLQIQTFSGCILYQQAFAQLFGDSVRTFKFQLSQLMNNLETLLNAETLHEIDSKSTLSVIKVQFERFINSDLLKPLDIYSRSFSSDREVIEIFRDYTKMTAQTFKETIIQNMNSIEQCIVKRESHEQELKMTLKRLSERQLQIQQCKVQEVQSSVTSSGDETSSGIVSDERKQIVCKALKKANASLTHDWNVQILTLMNPIVLLGEAIVAGDSCLIAFRNKLNEFRSTKPLLGPDDLIMRFFKQS